MLKVSLADALPLFEASLGLSQKSFSHYQRVMDYYSAIQNSGDAFFKESFLKDPLYVTSYLLKLRDELILNGWSGEVIGVKRIDDLAKIEKHFVNQSGYPERMKKVIGALNKPRKYQLPPLTVICHKASLSKLELCLLEASKLLVDESNKTLNPISYFEFTSSYDAGRALTNYLLNQKDNWKKMSVIVPSRSSELVRQYFKRAGIPYGSTECEATPFVSHVQVIVAMMNLTLLPKNAQIALKLLSLDVSPVKHFRLAEALRNTPSFESEAWKKAISKLEGMDEKVKEWILDDGCATPESIYKTLLVNKLKKLKSWFVTMGQMKKDETFLRSGSLCEELSLVIQGWNGETINFSDLQRMIRDVFSDGIKRESLVAQGQGPKLVSSPEEITEVNQEIIWFDFAEGTAGAKFNYYWSPEELNFMRKMGMTFHSTKTLTQAALSQWSKPLEQGPVKAFFALTSPEGSKESLHPLYYYKKQEFEKIPLNMLNQEKVKPNSWKPFTSQGEIKVASGSMYIPEVFSYSSLNNLLSCSARFYFERTLKLNDHDTESIEPGNLLYGNILHKCMELSFKEKVSPSDRGALIEKVIREFSPALSTELLSKKKIKLIRVIQQAFVNLDQFMELNKLEFLDAEKDFTQDFIQEHQLYGELDMLLGREGKVELVLDFKFSNLTKHQALLADKRAIQLSLYSYLAKKNGVMPAVAYYIATDEKFISNQRFEGASYFEMSTRDIVEYVQVKADSAVKDLKAGIIRINGLTDTKEKIFPSECGYCSYQKICGKAWEKV
jgi:ATP-dependent helicase/nuclease subunit B